MSFKRPVLFAILVSLLIPLPAGVAQDRPIITRNGVKLIVLPYATVEAASIWETTTIPVCWENPSPHENHLRALVREAVEETWMRHSRLVFTGWARCGARSQGIRIRVAEEGPHTKALGSFLDARPDGMVLNFSFRHWSPDCQKSIAFCIKAVAVHEFGHALGFAHEQNRKDAPPQCQLDAQGPDGDWNITDYDPYSIMNYCNTEWLGDGKLSARDIDAVTRMYGGR